jgi:MFS family permease
MHVRAVRPASEVPLRGQRPFLLLWFGETANALGMSVAVVALSLVAVVDLGATTFEVGLLTAAPGVAVVLLGLPAGVVADRLSCRTVMLACDAGTVLVFAGVAAAGSAGVLTVPRLLGAAFVGGALVVVFTAAYRAFIPAVVGRDQLPGAAAALQGGEWAVRVVGPGVAGGLTQLAGALGGAVLNAVTSFVSLLCVAALPADRRPGPPREAGTGPLREVGEGLRFVLADRFLRPMTAFTALTSLVRSAQQAVLVIFLVRELGTSAGVVGVLLTATGVGGVLGALLGPRLARRAGSARGLLVAQWVTAPCALLVPAAGPGAGLALFVVGCVGGGAGLVACTSAVAAFRMSYCPPRLLGRVGASMMTLGAAAASLGAVAGGLLGTAAGIRETLWACAAVLLVAPLVLMTGPLRTARDLPDGPAGPSGARRASVSVRQRRR